MPFFTDEELADFGAEQLSAMDKACTIRRQTRVRDGSGGYSYTWADASGATFVPCRISSSEGQAGLGQGGSERVVSEAEDSPKTAYVTLMTQAAIEEDDLVRVHELDEEGEPVTAYVEHEISEVRPGQSYAVARRLAVRMPGSSSV